MHPDRYDKLPINDKNGRFERVSPDFLVIAIGCPVPPYVFSLVA
jgi:hypothetical protein